MHVDGGLIVGELETLVKVFLDKLQKTYKLKITTRSTQHLGYTLKWLDNGELIIHHSNMISNIIEDFGMKNSRSVNTPAPPNIHELLEKPDTPFDVTTMQKVVGSLNHVALHT